MKKQNLNIGVEITDEDLLTMTGGESFLESSGNGGSGIVYPLYGITPTLKYGIRPQPLYGIIPAPEYGIVPLYGIIPAN